ncbi:MAG: response regulator [Bacteroidaceae bacterium]|nr:response regulator [Bacteroidaceae bacterium]
MKRTITTILCAALLALGVNAQVVRLYTNQHGLKTNNCYSVDIDSKGFVWVSGSNTLGLFDGTHFQYLPTTEADPLSPQGERPLFQMAYGVKEVTSSDALRDGNNTTQRNNTKDDADGKFWVCTSHGLFLLDARQMNYQHIFMQEIEDSIYGYATNAIIDYPKEHYKLVTTDGFNTYVLNTQTLKVDQKLTDQLNGIIQESFVTLPLIDKQGRLWVATKQAPLICIDLKTLKRHDIQYTPAAAAMIRNCTVNALLETDKGLMIGTNYGLFTYDEAQNMVEVAPITLPDGASSESLCISCIIRTHDGRILIGTDGRGIWQYKKQKGIHTMTPMYDQVADLDLSYGKVKDMKEDHRGNVIAVFLQKGLVVIPPQNDCFHYHPISPQANGKNATSVTSMAIDANENYWVGTDGCGVFTTNGMHLSTAHPVNEGLRSMLVQDIKIDKHGTVWVATFGGGVQYFESGRWVTTWLDTLKHELVMTMFYNPDTDQMLIGTNGNGILCADIASRTVTRMDIPFSYNPWLNSLLQDTNQTLWMGTSSGLYYYNPKTRKHNELKLGDTRICNASAIQQDGDHILVATDDGLLIYNPKTQEKQLIGKEQGLSNLITRSITVTPTHIWLATRTNIVSIDKQTHNLCNYSSFSGYQIGEFHRNASLLPGHGYVLFGGDNGIICFTPRLINDRPATLNHVYFTNFLTSRHTETLDANILYAQNIYLKPNNNTFTIEFSCVEISDPERIHYEYILEGHDDGWHTDITSPHARYSSLPSGRYTFRVRAYLEDNPSSYTENTITIHIAAPWYATWWAFLLYTLILLAIAWFIYQQLQARKQQKEQLRRSAEQDRMKEAKLRLFTSITHELRSPLTMIESPLRQLMAEDTNEAHQSLYTVMQRNCDRLLGIVKQITDIRKIDSGQLTLHLQEQDYVTYSDQVFQQFKGVATVKDIHFGIHHQAEELPMMIDTTHFEKIITNLLSNAFKFTPEGGTIIATSGIVGGQVELRFYNSGSHFADEDLAHLWERFYQGTASSESTGSGIGLNLVYELVRLHHGTIQAHNVNQPPITVSDSTTPSEQSKGTPTDTSGVEFILHFPTYNLPSATSSGSSQARPTVLLVDDDTELATYITSQLQRDYTIVYATSGNSAWKKVLAGRPDVVVTDYRMPDGNGIELCQQIKNNPETLNTPVIMLTGEGDETLQLHSLNLQVEHYLEKPVNLPMLRSAIQQVLRVRENLRNKARRTEIVSETPKPVIENAEDKLFLRINDAIRHHLDDSEFSVQQLSEEVGISRVHLNRKMKERYGISPNLFIKSFRLKQAAYLLVHNSVNVSEVAYTVGFSSHSYFTTSFHDYFGMSPKEFVTFYTQPENTEALDKLLQ